MRTRPLLWWTAATSVAVILVKVLISGISFKWSSWSFDSGIIDGGLVIALLTPTLTALVAHGHDKLKDKDIKP